MGACCLPRTPGALSIPRKHRSYQSHGLRHKQAGHEKYCVTQHWSSDDGCHHKGELSPALKLHPGTCPAQEQTPGQPYLRTRRNSYKEQCTQGSRAAPLLCSGSPLTYPLHCGSVADCRYKHRSKGSCSEPNASTPTTTGLNPCTTPPSVPAAQLILSTAALWTCLYCLC